jgi:DNA mismatch repair ATPase MutS
VIERAREILFNLEKKELDDAGLPRIAYGSSPDRDKSQFLLFSEDREREFLEEIKQEIESLNVDNVSPLEALNLLSDLKDKIARNQKG